MQTNQYLPDDLPDALRWQILSLMRVTFTEGFVGRWRGRRWISRPEFNPVHFVMTDDDFVVAHAEVVSEAWQHRGVDYAAYGISGVFVYPDYRRQGHGVEIIQSATDYITRQPDADIGMFWCEPHLREFYLRCGWQHMANITTMLGDAPATSQVHTEEILFMRFFSDKGRQHQPDFESGRLYFGWTTW